MAVICDELPYVSFTQVRNAWLRDPRISLKAKGLLSYLRSHTAGYCCSHAQMVRESSDGKDAVYTALRELEAAGYLTRVLNRSGGRFAEDDYRLADPFDLHGKLIPAPEIRPSHAEDGRKIRQSGKSASADYPARQIRPIEDQGENTKESPSDSPDDEARQLALVPHHSAEELFDVFWAAYPKKVGKDAARRAWGKAARRADPDKIAEVVGRYPFRPDRQFVKDPATWLNAGCWEDDLEAVAAANRGRSGTGSNYGPRYQNPDPKTDPDAFGAF